MSNALKDLRKQLKNLVQDNLPGIVSEELVKALHKALSAEMNSRIDAIAKNIQETLDQVDRRSKDVQSYVMRQHSEPKVIKVKE